MRRIGETIGPRGQQVREFARQQGVAIPRLRALQAKQHGGKGALRVGHELALAGRRVEAAGLGESGGGSGERAADRTPCLLIGEPDRDGGGFRRGELEWQALAP